MPKDNDDLENLNNPEEDVNLEPPIDEEPVAEEDDAQEVSVDDIFANIPPMPEDYDVSSEIPSAYSQGGQNETVTVQPVQFASFVHTVSPNE